MNWSTASKLAIGERLAKSKEFVGKINLAAGNTLWLHPVSSFKYLKELNLNIIDDCVRYQLVLENFGIDYPSHLKELTNNFVAANLPVARQEDEEFKREQNCTKLLASFYENPEDATAVTYAHLDVSNDLCRVFMSACDTPARFWIQKKATNTLLDRLNSDIGQFVDKVNERLLAKKNVVYGLNRDKGILSLKKNEPAFDPLLS